MEPPTKEVPTFEGKEKETIRESHYVLVRLPSEGMKVVFLKKDERISLGKFGSFNVNDVLGYPLGQSFEVISGDGVKPIKSIDENVEIEDDAIEEEITQDKLIKLFPNSAESNQNIINIGSKIQKLTTEDITELKKSGATSNIGQLIIQKMVEGHGGFDKKTIFSQQKYLKRKQQKFLRRFTIEYFGSSQMLQYYLEKDRAKLMDMSEETLGSLLTYANVRPGGKYLIIDETGGIVLYSMLERMNYEGTIVLIHEHEHANFSALKHSNVDEAIINSVVKPINWLQLLDPEAEKIDFIEFPEEQLQEMKGPRRSQYYKRLRRSQEINEVIDIVANGNFDAFIGVTTLDTLSYLTDIIPKVGGSRPVVIYSQFKEHLLTVQSYLNTDKRMLAPSIVETRVRPYQTIPGRMHPVMTMRGYGGYIVTATRVFPKGSVQAVGRGLGRKRKDRDSEPPQDTPAPEVSMVPEAPEVSEAPN